MIWSFDLWSLKQYEENTMVSQNGVQTNIWWRCEAEEAKNLLKEGPKMTEEKKWIKLLENLVVE